MTEDSITVITDINKICRTCLCEKSETEMSSLYQDSLDLMLYRLTFVKVKTSKFFFEVK